MSEQTVSEEIVAKVLSMLPDHSMVEQLMDTGEFPSSDVIYAALHILERRGKVVGVDPFRYIPPKEK